MSVRQAISEDLPRIVDMYRCGLIEVGETVILEDKIATKVHQSFYLAPCFLLADGDKIVGMAGLTCVTPAWSNATSLADYMFFIEKEYRNLKNLGALVQSCKDFALENKLSLRLEFVVGSKEARERLARIHGFDKTIVIGVFNG